MRDNKEKKKLNDRRLELLSKQALSNLTIQEENELNKCIIFMRQYYPKITDQDWGFIVKMDSLIQESREFRKKC